MPAEGLSKKESSKIARDVKAAEQKNHSLEVSCLICGEERVHVGTKQDMKFLLAVETGLCECQIGTPWPRQLGKILLCERVSIGKVCVEITDLPALKK